MIVNIVCLEKESNYGNDVNPPMKISHVDGLNAIESAIEYIEQLEEATPAILLSLKNGET